MAEEKPQLSMFVDDLAVKELERRAAEQFNIYEPDSSAYKPAPPITDVSFLYNDTLNVDRVVTTKRDNQQDILFFTRCPMYGFHRFPREKLRDERHVLAYLRRYTRIPVPTVHHIGETKDPKSIPFMITSLIKGVPLSKFMQDPKVITPILNPEISKEDLIQSYEVMASVTLLLSQVRFSRIGGIRQDQSSGTWSVTKRPLTRAMCGLMCYGNLPPRVFADRPFDTASEYFVHLADLHLLHLRYQRNDAVEDEEDCRRKYIARCLFRKIAREYKALPGPFPLYSDGLTPLKVLVDEDTRRGTGVMDWEYTYAAPVEFTHIPPWWLLLERPERWETDLTKFRLRFLPRYSYFLWALRRTEDTLIKKNILREDERLTEHMARAMGSGLFWFVLAAQWNYAFDDIYWTFLDEKHFGTLGSLDCRLALLSDEEREELDGFVQMKMAQKKERKLDEHPTDEEPRLCDNFCE